MNPAVIAIADPFIHRWEQCRLVAYQDVRGVWTLGWGSTTQIDGMPIRQGDTWTQDQADARFEAYLADESVKLDALTHPALPDQCKAALLSFAYNVGVTAYAGSTMLRDINGGAERAAADEFPRWDIANHKVVEGLKDRRLAEQALFLDGLNDQATLAVA